MSIKNSFEKIRYFFTKNQEAIDASRMDSKAPYMLIDGKGRHCPIDMIHPVDLTRHDLVNNRLEAAKVLLTQLQEFKQQTFADVETFIELSAADYEVKMGGTKGNLQLVNHSDTRKLRVSVQDRISFDERLQVAKQLFDELIAEHSNGLDEVIAVLIQEVFKVDKAGKIDTKKVLELRRYNVKHPKWTQAMAAINDSIKVVGSKSYIQLYERDTPNDDWRTISLDLAKV